MAAYMHPARVAQHDGVVSIMHEFSYGELLAGASSMHYGDKGYNASMYCAAFKGIAMGRA